MGKDITNKVKAINIGSAQLTSTKGSKGYEKKGTNIVICAISWFDVKKIDYGIANTPSRTSTLTFTGKDLNFLARVLYAESSGSAQLVDITLRKQEKEALLNVFYFRLNRTDYPSRKVSKTFTDISLAKDQFTSIGEPKYRNSSIDKSVSLDVKECSDLQEAVDAIKQFLIAGPNKNYIYDNFRGYRPGGQGTHIGRSRFWLSKKGKELSDATP